MWQKLHIGCFLDVRHVAVAAALTFAKLDDDLMQDYQGVSRLREASMI